MESQIQTVCAWLGSGSINLFGQPFAGKDTQARKLAELLYGVHIGGGEILRSYEDQAQLKQLLSTGELFPTELYLRIIIPYLSRQEIEGKPLILSSVGRRHGEEAGIIEATTASNHPLKAVVLLQMPEKAIFQRYEQSLVQQDRGERTDDRREVLQTRLDEFKNKTQPVIEIYRDMNLLIEVDGTKSPDEVTEAIIAGLAERASAD